MRILIMEDDEPLAHSARRVLADAGHDVAIGTSLASGQGLIESFDPELIILDLNLGDSHGAETMEAVHAQVGHYTPVIIFTGMTMHADRCLELGAVEYMVKGRFTPLDLPEAVDRAVARHRVMRAVMRSNRDFSGEEQTSPGLAVIGAGRVGDHLISVADEVKSCASG